MKKVFRMRIATRPVPLSPGDERALSRIEDYDWVLFTSKHGVNYFPGKVPKRVRVGVVGPATARAALKRGFRVDVVPRSAMGLELASALPELRGMRILFPRSAVADSCAPRALRARGAHVRVIALYTTLPKKIASSTKIALLKGRYSHLEFKSPSAIRGFLKQFSEKERSQLRSIPVCVIGPTTAHAGRTAGFKKISIGI